VAKSDHTHDAVDPQALDHTPPPWDDELWHGAARCRGCWIWLFLGEDLIAQLDTVVTDKYTRPGNQALHLILMLAAKRT
jgi:hypothetical protein